MNNFKIGTQEPSGNMTNTINDINSSIIKNKLEFTEVLNVLVNLLGATITSMICKAKDKNSETDETLRREITENIFEHITALIKMNV